MAHISYSALKNWVTCPYYYKLTYEDRIRLFNGNIYTAFGTAIHEVCENKLLDPTIDGKTLFTKSFKENLMLLPDSVKSELTKKNIKEFHEQGISLCDHIVPAIKETFGDNVKIVSTEEDLMVPIDYATKEEFSFKGFIDLVIQTEDGKHHIIDWKSCSWGWNFQKRTDKILSYQLTLYKRYYCKKHNIDPNMVETHFGLLKRTAKKDKVELFRVTSGPRKMENSLTLLNKALYNIDNQNFIKKKSSCGQCEFKGTQHCP